MKFLTLALLFGFTLAPTMAAQKIKFCEGGSKEEVQAAFTFIQNNVDTILNDVAGMTKAEKKKYKKKIKNLNLKCKDHKKLCDKTDRGGRSQHTFRSAVVICYNNIRSFFGSDAFCGLVDTVAHETAHASGVKKQRGHNNGPNNDRVYRLGRSAESVCVNQNANRSIVRNTNDN